ncbi:hypothetical protein MMC26_007754 [Xylographa opegraphella]|nr:hypothetical protein [Xylographa opegraphella]
MLGNRILWMTAAGLASIVVLYPATKLRLGSILALSQPGSIWRILAIVFAILNLKSLPFAWHVRLFHGLFTHIRPRTVGRSTTASSALFQPIITSSRTSILECDYNIHKSNSTYFSDLDVSRLHHIACLMSLGMGKARTKFLAEQKGSFNIMLGGVTCSFKKEIKPLEPFEIWTRVLTWDQKWLYLVSHIVKSNAVEPRGYTLQPWKKTVEGKRRVEHAQATPHPAIFATSVAKYVFKQGRVTISPERVLEASALLPPRPIIAEQTSTSGNCSAPGLSGDRASQIIDIGSITSQSGLQAESVLSQSLMGPEVGVWDGQRMEQERDHGMSIAKHMAGLDALHDVFTADNRPALGQY